MKRKRQEKGKERADTRNDKAIEPKQTRMEKPKPIRKYTKKRILEKGKQKPEDKVFALFKKKEKKQAAPATASTPVVALDCEMVGSFNADLLARVSICDGDGQKLLDEIVRPPGRVTDYREHITGLTPQVIFERGITFAAARALVRTIIQDKILIGHAVHNDLQVLALRHPLHLIRDTSTYKRLRPPNYHGTPSLRHLVRHWFGETIQTGVHDSLEDCRAALRMYHLFKDEWEHQFSAVRNNGPLKVQDTLQAVEEDLGSPAAAAATAAIDSSVVALWKPWSSARNLFKMPTHVHTHQGRPTCVRVDFPYTFLA